MAFSAPTLSYPPSGVDLIGRYEIVATRPSVKQSWFNMDIPGDRRAYHEIQDKDGRLDIRIAVRCKHEHDQMDIVRKIETALNQVGLVSQ